MTDVIGYFTFLLKKKGLGPITICTGIKNRSENYLNVLLASLKECENKELIQLSIYDCHSTDVPDLESEIKKKWDGVVTFYSEEIDFTRSYSFNKAIKQSCTELLFICDADMSIPSNIVSLVNKYVTKKSSWFPISLHLDKTGMQGKFKMEGKGIFASSKSHLEKIGYYNEDFKTWGDEDWEMFFRFYKSRIRPHRTKEQYLIHHYHESKRPEDYKSIYVK